MSYPSPAPHTDQVVNLADPQGVDPAKAAAAEHYRLSRPGARPLSFYGSELAMAMSYTPAQPYWYELNIYHTTEQKFVLAVRLFFQSEEVQDRMSAWEFESLAEAFDKLEAYDAASDLMFDVTLPSGSSAAEFFAYGTVLRGRVAEVRQHFGGLVGEFMHQVEQGA